MANLMLYLFLKKKCDFSVVIFPWTVNTDGDLHVNKKIIYCYFYPYDVNVFQRRQGALPNDVGTGSYRGDFKGTQKKKMKKFAAEATSVVPG